MPPNPSAASGNNSRQSVQASGFAAGSGSAATSRTPKSVTFADGGKKKVLDGSDVAERMKKKDSKLLTVLAEHVVSLPLQIATVIEKDTTSMLDLYREISLKSKPLAHFDLKFKKKDGEEERYLPGCVRKLANPTTGTHRIRDLDAFKTIVSNYENVLKKYKDDATNLLKLVAELEVSHREQLLFELMCKSAARLAKNLITAAVTRAKIADPEFKTQIDKDTLAWRIARDYCLDHIKDERLKTLKFDSSNDMKVAFDKVRQSVSVNECQNTFDEPSEGSQEEDEDLLRAEAEDRQIYEFAMLQLASTVPKMTFDIWALVSEEDLLSSINEELTVLNKNEEQSKINESTADAMANDQALTKSTILDLFKTEMGKLKKEIRSNSSAVPKTQGAAGGKPGQKSRKRQRDAADGSPAGSSKKKQKKESQKKKKSQQKKNQQQQQQQTGNQQQQQHQRQKQRRNNKAGRGGSRGGANSGGRGRGSNRR